MAACLNETNWFVTIQTALKDLTAEQASAHGIGAPNNIAGIVNHIVYWNERYLNHYRGIKNPKMEIENEQTFNTSNPVLSEKDWSEIVARLYRVLGEFYEEVKNADEEKLQSSSFGGTDDSWYSVFANSSIHIAYHIGQIVTLRKEQGSWNPDLGVK